MDWIDIAVSVIATGYVVGVAFYALKEAYSENI